MSYVTGMDPKHYAYLMDGRFENDLKSGQRIVREMVQKHGAGAARIVADRYFKAAPDSILDADTSWHSKLRSAAMAPLVRQAGGKMSASAIQAAKSTASFWGSVVGYLHKWADAAGMRTYFTAASSKKRATLEAKLATTAFRKSHKDFVFWASQVSGINKALKR